MDKNLNPPEFQGGPFQGGPKNSHKVCENKKSSHDKFRNCLITSGPTWA